MPLQPPVNYQNSFLALSIGFGVGLFTFFLTRSNIPIAGDAQHRFPFGGCYQDGTKRATYLSPGRNFYSSYPSTKFLAFVLIIVITLCLLYSRYQGGRNTCAVCNRNHESTALHNTN